VRDLHLPLVAQGTLGADLANHPDAPLDESAATFLGTWAGWSFWPERASPHLDS